MVEVIKVMMMMVMERFVGVGKERRIHHVGRWSSGNRRRRRWLVMMLAEDERANHAERGSLDEVGLANVAREATGVEQMIPSAHNQFV